MARTSVGRRYRPSVKQVFSDTVKPIHDTFRGNVAILHISRPFFFSFFKILGVNLE